MSAIADYEHARLAGEKPYLELDEAGIECCIVAEDGFEYQYHAPTTGETMEDQTAADAQQAQQLTPAQQEAQATIDRGDYVAMLTKCLPTLHSEYFAARFMLAELKREGDVQVKKEQFMKVAGKILGGLPPMTEAALSIIAAQRQG
jgi:hypothetical protein